MQLTIDSREQSRIQSATEYYKKQGIDVEVKRRTSRRLHLQQPSML